MNINPFNAENNNFFQTLNTPVAQHQTNEVNYGSGCGNGNISNAQMMGSGIEYVESLTGERVPASSLTHNNMVHFYSGQPYNADYNRVPDVVGRMTGADRLEKPKQEQRTEQFADIKRENIYGNQTIKAKHLLHTEGRYITTEKRQNEKPFEQIRVGPGLAAGYSAKPTGGLNQANSRQYVMPKTVDELRAKTRQKASGLEGRVIKGSLPGGTRGKIGRVDKKLPSKFYENTPDKYFKTGGGLRAMKMREKVYAKPTMRQNHRSYYGGLSGVDNKATYKVAAYKKSTKNIYNTPAVGNATALGKWTVGGDDGVGDYGLASFENKPNERDITQSRSIISNLTAEIKKFIMPMLDAVRETRKETTIGNARPEGFMHAAMPARQTVYDPNDVLRTTLKEQLIHDTHEGFLGKTVEKQTVYDPNDPARTTLKEQLIHDTHEGFLGKTVEKQTVYDPNDVARTTLKEQLIHDTHDGFIKGEGKQTVYDPDDVPRTTIKELNTENKTPFINAAPQRPKCLRVYDPDDVARTTIRQLLEYENFGFLSKPEKTDNGAYTTRKIELKATHKQYLVDNEYFGNATKINSAGKGYLTTRYKARNTNRQFLTKYYQGNAGYYQPRQTSYATAYTMRHNGMREDTLKQRFPAKQGVKQTNGKDALNVKIKKIEGDIINRHEPATDKITVSIPQKNGEGMTRIKQNLPNNIQQDRLDPSLLSAFNVNPYTKPLNSVA